MFLCYRIRSRPCSSFPRIRGDVPFTSKPNPVSQLFSPHTRGCSFQPILTGVLAGVFPAYAGMFRAAACRPPLTNCFPRIRGDVPASIRDFIKFAKFSPHTRGCSYFSQRMERFWGVFPAYAGMFRVRFSLLGLPRCFPRIRGDVPGSLLPLSTAATFSPHTRGCSSCVELMYGHEIVFPAYAGMFLIEGFFQPCTARFPRIRGDVPGKIGAKTGTGMFSPHTRGCS